MSNRSDQLIRALALLSLLLLLPVAAIASLLQRPISRTRAEVAALLEREARGEECDMEWDEFTCVRITDPEVDAIRAAIVRAEEAGTLTPELLNHYAHQLRRTQQANAGDDPAP